jgi:hypothetical protein
MRLFVPNPTKGFIVKLKKYIGLNNPVTTIKEFTEKVI